MMRARGFSLTEVLVVLAIVGILASVAYPSYAGYVIRARRTEGQLALIDAMQKEERYYSQHNTYLAFSRDGDDTDAGAAQLHWYSGASADKSAYEIQAAACEGGTLRQCVVLRAIPGTRAVDPAFRDPECGTLSLHSSGERTASGPANGCWP
ncbi:type IV pilin protein [Zemynaea arenosa]|nr:type IV pilin protein [Massilia arenosa]